MISTLKRNNHKIDGNVGINSLIYKKTKFGKNIFQVKKHLIKFVCTNNFLASFLNIIEVVKEQKYTKSRNWHIYGTAILYWNELCIPNGSYIDRPIFASWFQRIFDTSIAFARLIQLLLWETYVTTLLPALRNSLHIFA